MTAHFKPTPLTANEMVPDDVLRQLSGEGDTLRAQGIISDEDTALLCLCLPELMGELMAYRAAARAGHYIANSEPVMPFPHPRNHGEEIANIRATTRATDGREVCPYNGQGLAFGTSPTAGG